MDFLRMDEEYGCEVVAGEPSDICFAEQQAHYTLWAIAGSPLSGYSRSAWAAAVAHDSDG